MKKGESEAMQILKSKGIIFDESYCDDNSKESMPDLRYADGRFLEVTHTNHNNGIVTTPNKFNQKSIREQLKISEQAGKAYDRVNNFKYPKNEKGVITLEGKNLFQSDYKILKNHFGFDMKDTTKPTSEFNCDVPVIYCSSDNIIHEIVSDKGKKYSNRDVDLFIFILEGEYESVQYLLRTGYQNGCYMSFMHNIMCSPFQTIYLCVWDFKNQTYIITNPILLKFWKNGNGKLKYKLI